MFATSLQISGGLKTFFILSLLFCSVLRYFRVRDISRCVFYRVCLSFVLLFCLYYIILMFASPLQISGKLIFFYFSFRYAGMISVLLPFFCKQFSVSLTVFYHTHICKSFANMEGTDVFCVLHKKHRCLLLKIHK